MGKIEIKSIIRSDKTEAHERITHICGNTNSGWRMSIETAISRIEKYGWKFVINYEGNEVDVIVAENKGRKYLKSKNDTLQPNNLLNLPDYKHM